MNWKFFNKQYFSMDELRKHYREMCLQYHPDKNPDNVDKFTELFKQLLNEYDLFLEYFIPGENRKQERANSNKRYDYETESELGRKVADMMRYSGLVIEICGSWIWLSGDTFRWKDQIKQSNFRWQGKKKMWYWAGEEFKPHRAKTIAMDDIRSKYGSIELIAEERQAMA